ncbi:MAG: DUF177 domain-containing protein [Myxococcota bacterium]
MVVVKMMAAKDSRLMIDVDALTHEGWEFHDVIAREQLTALLQDGGPQDLEALTPMRVKLAGHKVPQGLRLLGSADAHLSTPCSRCLKPASVHVALQLGMTLFPASAPEPEKNEDEEAAAARGGRRGKGKRRKPKEEVVEFVGEELTDDVDTGTYEQGTVDVAAILREHTLLELPMTPLCREDCKGLCQSCGADLNAGPCACPPSGGDPRLAVLAKFKIQ